jgi:hypothetical protein
LQLTESLEECRALDYCDLFQDGDLLLSGGWGKDTLQYFNVECIEVWAVGGHDWITESLRVQQQQRNVQEAAWSHAAQVHDKRALYRDFLQQEQRGGGNGNGGAGGNHGYFAHMSHQDASDRCDV